MGMIDKWLIKSKKESLIKVYKKMNLGIMLKNESRNDWQ